MNNKRVWTYYRVSDPSQRVLINYQKKLLTRFLEDKGFHIVGSIEEIGKGNNLDSRSMSNLKTHIRRHTMDYIFVYDYTRLLIHQDLLIELQMFCELNNVQIISMQDFKESVTSAFLFCR